MAAATQSNAGEKLAVPFLVRQVELSAMTGDQQETITHTGLLGCVPFDMTWDLLDRPTDASTVSVEHVSDSASAGTSTVRVYTQLGGDLTGATVKLSFWFINQARQDGQSITLDNNT